MMGPAAKDAPLRPDLCVIGAGSAGLTVAAGAAQMGASVVLIERGAMGGDCLNTGCVPSKALLAAARAAQSAREADRFGIRVGEPVVDFGAVMSHVHDVIAGIAPHDSQDRFEGLGVTVIRESASFLGPRTIAAGAHRIRARRFLIATGSRPGVPPIPGLLDGPFLTNETVFALTERPTGLIILGGGPIGCEMAQAFRRLGCPVSLIERDHLLGRDDPEMAAVVRAHLVDEGVDIREGRTASQVAHHKDSVRVNLADATGTADDCVEGSHLLVALGREPVTDGLNLEAADITATKDGITVTDSLMTTNRRVYAIGDVVGGPQFTHVAAHHGALMIRRLLFRLPVRASAAPVPHVTYTDPELAGVGLTEAQARARHGDTVRVLRAAFADNDRARAERRTEGLIKVVTTRRGRILGAAIVGAEAGDQLAPWCLALQEGIRIKALATTILPYPTRGEAGRRAAGAFFAPSLFAARTRALVRFLARFG